MPSGAISLVMKVRRTRGVAIETEVGTTIYFSGNEHLVVEEPIGRVLEALQLSLKA